MLTMRKPAYKYRILMVFLVLFRILFDVLTNQVFAASPGSAQIGHVACLIVDGVILLLVGYALDIYQAYHDTYRTEEAAKKQQY